MPTLATDLWSLTKGQPYIDAALLPRAIEEQIQSDDLDYRTRLLIRDTVDALRAYWGEPRVREWLEASPVRAEIEVICAEEHEKVGFPSLRRRFVEPTEPREIEGFLTDLGRRLRHPVRIAVGGSAVLILGGLLRRATDDIDVVDEVPAEIRTEYKILEELEAGYGLKIAHFQSHYLAMRWQNRTHTIGPFDNLHVSLLDPHDVCVSKLFSIRSKDVSDLRVLFPQLVRETLVQRIQDDCQSMLAAPDLRKRAEDNWFILTGESLPI